MQVIVLALKSVNEDRPKNNLKYGAGKRTINTAS